MRRSPPRRLAVSSSSDARERSAFHSAAAPGTVIGGMEMTRSMDKSWLTVSRVGVGALIAAALLTVVPLLASDARAAAKPWSSTTSAFVICAVDATLQICDPAHVHKVSVPQGKKIHVTRLRYTAASTHCSSGRL